MSTFETAGSAMLQLHEANRGVAFAIARAFGAVFAAPAILPRDQAFTGATLRQLEPGLAQEARQPDYIRSF